MTDDTTPLHLDPDSPEAREVQLAIDIDAQAPPEYLPDTDRPQPYTPSNQRAAEWAMSLAARSAAYIAEQEQLRDDWVAQIRANHLDAVAAHRRRLDLMEGALRRFALAWHDQDPRTHKTLHLPSGSVATRTPTTPTVLFAGDAGRVAVLAWLSTLDAKAVAEAEAVKFSDPEVKISGVRKLVTVMEKDGKLLPVDPTSGEVVEGLVVDPPGETTATVKPHGGP
jgi:hypothetical protein